jgi:phosphotransferase system enzyme I (PtsI)
MRIKQGIPVSPGVAISQAVILDAQDVPIPRRHVPRGQIAHEKQRVTEALSKSCDDLQQLRAQAAASIGEEPARIFDFHLGMLRDPVLVQQFEQRIESEAVKGEYAVYIEMRQLALMYQQQDSRYFRDRVGDIWDLERRVLGHLIGTQREQISQLKREVVLIAHDLTPSQTAALDKTHIKGIATEAGGRTSHTAILAHALGIPAIVGLEDITADVNTGQTLIIDGNRGQVIIDPDAAQLLEYRQHIKRLSAFESSLGELVDLPAETTDGQTIQLQANIEFPQEIGAALEKGAQGIGLYRTEFLFLASENEPTEDEQTESYTQAVKALGGRPMTIRTLDLGADKIWSGSPGDHTERNPFLGLRSIRFCLQHLPLFKMQLRAILRASVAGPIKIMFPLISNVMELRQAKMILSDVMEDLDDQGIEYDHDIPVGIMIEVPSAALQAKVFNQEVDFFSIGTNDLIQYTVAVDRGNERIASLYSAAHPAVIGLIRDVVRAANRVKIDVSLCGEMAGQPEFVMLLVGLGLRNFSITPPAIPEVKKIIRSVSIEQCNKVARQAMAYDSDREVLNFLRDELRKIVPEVLDGGFV